MILLTADYSAIEARIMARAPSTSSIHVNTAKEIFRTEHPSKDQVRRAKAYNYAMAYNSSHYRWW